IAPLDDIPYPIVDLSSVTNPVGIMIEAREFALTDQFFNQPAAVSRSLVSVRSQALIFALVRNLRPAHVLEIGTYFSGTSEAICRALHANGFGKLHTTDPFCADIAALIIKQWPAELRERIQSYALGSMAFYMEIARTGDIQPHLVFVDGNHDYEYAAFD